MLIIMWLTDNDQRHVQDGAGAPGKQEVGQEAKQRQTEGKQIKQIIHQKSVNSEHIANNAKIIMYVILWCMSQQLLQGKICVLYSRKYQLIMIIIGLDVDMDKVVMRDEYMNK